MRFKNIFSVGTGIQILLLIGAIAVQEFSMKRMGMMRHIMFLNQEWEANLPLEAIKTTLIAILILLFVGVTARLYASLQKPSEKRAKIIWLTTGVITLAPILFSKLYSTESYRSYYIMGLTLAIIAIIQNLKAMAILKTNRR